MHGKQGVGEPHGHLHAAALALATLHLRRLPCPHNRHEREDDRSVGPGHPPQPAAAAAAVPGEHKRWLAGSVEQDHALPDSCSQACAAQARHGGLLIPGIVRSPHSALTRCTTMAACVPFPAGGRGRATCGEAAAPKAGSAALPPLLRLLLLQPPSPAARAPLECRLACPPTRLPAACTTPWSLPATTWAPSPPHPWPSSTAGLTSWQTPVTWRRCCLRCHRGRWCTSRCVVWGSRGSGGSVGSVQAEVRRL